LNDDPQSPDAVEDDAPSDGGDESNAFLKEQLELMKFYQEKTKPKEAEVIDTSDPYVKEQMEALRFFEEKRMREAEDARIAKEVARQVVQPQPKPQPAGGVDPDLAFALKIQEQERTEELRRQSEMKKTRAEQDAVIAKKMFEEEQERLKKTQKMAEDDAALAKKLLEEEEKRVKADKEKMDWEKTMDMIKTEAKAQADEELAKLLKEKEELESRLRTQTTVTNGGAIILQGVEYPKYWQPQVHNHQSFDVPRNSQEWKWIEGRFHEGIKNNLHRIERNQNKELWMWYWLKKKQMDAKNKRFGANEKYAFHGSRNDAYNIILKEGFDHRVANMGGAIGAGVYFAHSSATSNGYVVTAPGGGKKMLFCFVAIGEIGPGAHGLRRPPPKSNTNTSAHTRHHPTTGVHASEDLYDSVGNDGGVYVVFDNYQAFPAYVIHFN